MSLAAFRLVATALMLVIVMIVSAWMGRRSIAAVLVLLLTSLAWLTVDKLWEGPHLIEFDRQHSLVTADLVGLAGVAVAAVLGVRWLRTRRSQ